MVLGLPMYLFSKNYLTFADFLECFNYILNTPEEKHKSIIKHSHSSEELDQGVECNHTNFILHKSLRHLEFINEFEAYLNTNNDHMVTAEFLHELKQSKYDTQVAILKSTQMLSTRAKKHAA